MYHIAVLEDSPGQLSRILEGFCTDCGESLILTRGDSARALGRSYDFIVVYSEMAVAERWDGASRCNVLLVPGKYAARAAEAITSGCIVSFGMSTRDTITLSSVDDGRPVLAIQRELVTLGGEVLERQEIPIRLQHPVPADTLMAAAGVMLILNVKPENLEALLGKRTFWDGTF